MFENIGFERRLVGPSKSILVLTLRELGFKVGPSFFKVESVCFRLQSEREILSFSKLLS
jgi:hypothetical protein